LKAGGEISYKEGSTESQNIVPRCFRDLLPLTVDFQLPNASTSCGSIGCMGVDLNYRSKQMIEITGNLPQCKLCMNLQPILCMNYNTNVGCCERVCCEDGLYWSRSVINRSVM